jgi:hypothetical protein
MFRDQKRILKKPQKAALLLTIYYLPATSKPLAPINSLPGAQAGVLTNENVRPRGQAHILSTENH